MTEDQLKAAYVSWWQDSYGTPPNNQATAVAVAWGQHLLTQQRPAKPPLWQDLEVAANLPSVVHGAEWAAVLQTVANRIEIEPSIVRVHSVSAFLRDEARKAERGEA